MPVSLQDLLDLNNDAIRVVQAVPISAAVTVPNPLGVSGTVSIGNLPTSQPITIIDGGSISLGSLVDLGVTGDASGSVNAHLRGMDKILADVWDSINHQLRTNASSTSIVTQGPGGVNPWAVSGSVTVLNASSNNQGTGNAGSSPWAVSGTVTVTNALTTNIPNPIGVSGTVSIGSVSGPTPSGSIYTGNPLLIAGTDVGAVLRNLLLNSDGSQAVGGFTAVVNTSLTRPANTTTYTANTALANATSSASQMTFANCARANGYSGEIRGAKLFDFTNQTTVLQSELWIFDTSLSTVINDNATWLPVSGDVQNLVGVIPFNLNYIGNNNGTAGTGQVVFEAYNLCLPFKCGSSSRNLFGQLVVRNAYVPVTSELFIVRLDLALD